MSYSNHSKQHLLIWFGIVLLHRVRPWFISLLVHALLFFGMWQLRTSVPTLQPTPLTVSLWTAPATSQPTASTPQQPEPKPATPPVLPKLPTKTSHIQQATPTTRATTQTVTAAPTAALKSNPVKQATSATPATNNTKAAQSGSSLFDRASGYLQTQQQRELSSTELQALSQRSEVSRSRPIAQQHRAELAASGMASNVLDVLDDGRQMVKVGQSCFLASPSTDLLKDPLSAKSVPCDTKASTADQINSILEQRRNRHLDRD